jgi:uncharacterized protein YndB with AHSA1/START domain
MLPQHHEASRSAHLNAPPDSVWAVLADIDAYPKWRADVRSVERLPDRDGRPVWMERSAHGAVTYEALRFEAPSVLETRIATDGLPYGGRWVYALSADGAGTRLTITEYGEVYNPVFRALARFVFGYTATMDAYLEALSRRVTPKA